MPRCFKCGSLYGISDYFCPECGERLNPKRFRFLNKYSILTMGVILICLFLFFLNIQKTSPRPLVTPFTTLSANKQEIEDYENVLQQNQENKCKQGYSNEYTCSSVYSLRKYQKEDCSYKWVKWKHCGQYDCKMEGENVICDYENRRPAFENVGFCTYSELEAFENNGLWTSRHISYEYSDTISDRAKIGIPLLVQGSLSASYGKEKNKLTEGVCNVRNAQINLYIYKNDFELFFDTVFTDDYGRWESEEFIPREIGYHKLVINWLNRNADSQERSWNSEEVTFYVSE